MFRTKLTLSFTEINEVMHVRDCHTLDCQQTCFIYNSKGFRNSLGWREFLPIWSTVLVGNML